MTGGVEPASTRAYLPQPGAGIVYSEMAPIFPYGPPVALAANLWQVTGSLALPVPRNMTIVWRHGAPARLGAATALSTAAAQREPRCSLCLVRHHAAAAQFFAPDRVARKLSGGPR